MPTPRKYPDELRERGVRLVFESGRPVAHVARDLGVHRETLRLWVRQAEADAGQRSDRLTTSERERLKELEKENRELRRERDPQGGERLFRPGARPDPAEAVSFIDAHKHRFGVEPICRVLDVAPSTDYARRSRPPSRQAVEDARLLGRIRELHAANYAAYGSRRTWKTLRGQGVEVGRGRIERVMRQHGICGAQRRAKRRGLTRAQHAAPRAGDLVERRFVAERPNELWVCDLTYLKTYEGFVYLAFVKDVFSRTIVGRQTATHPRTDLVLDALEMAVHRRRPRVGELVHHTDRGSQYTSFRYTQRLSELGITASVGSVADAYDNAMAESFVATLKAELLRGRPFKTRFEAELAVVEYLGWFNHTRLHSSLGDLPPAQFEIDHAANTTMIETPPAH